MQASLPAPNPRPPSDIVAGLGEPGVQEPLGGGSSSAKPQTGGLTEATYRRRMASDVVAGLGGLGAAAFGWGAAAGGAFFGTAGAAADVGEAEGEGGQGEQEGFHVRE